MPIFWFLGTTLRPSYQVQVFSLRLHLFQLVTATNGVKNKWNWDKPEATSTKWRFKTKKTVQRGDNNSLYELQMPLLESEVWGHREEQKWHGQEQSQTIENVLNNHKRRYVQHLNWSVLCFVGDDIWELHTQIATVFSCEIKESFVWQSLFVRCNKLRILTWIASWEQFSPHITITSPPLFKCEITSAPRKVRIFLCQNKRKCWFHPTTTVGKMHSLLFSLMIGWYLRFVQFCSVGWKALLEQKYPHKSFQFFFFLLTQKNQHFPLCFSTSLAELYFHSIHSLFWKNNSSFVLFLFWSFQKKRKKNALKDRLKLLFVQVFFFPTGNKSKKQS